MTKSLKMLTVALLLNLGMPLVQAQAEDNSDIINPVMVTDETDPNLELDNENEMDLEESAEVIEELSLLSVAAEAAEYKPEEKITGEVITDNAQTPIQSVQLVFENIEDETVRFSVIEPLTKEPAAEDEAELISLEEVNPNIYAFEYEIPQDAQAGRYKLVQVEVLTETETLSETAPELLIDLTLTINEADELAGTTAVTDETAEDALNTTYNEGTELEAAAETAETAIIDAELTAETETVETAEETDSVKFTEETETVETAAIVDSTGQEVTPEVQEPRTSVEVSNSVESTGQPFLAAAETEKPAAEEQEPIESSRQAEKSELETENKQPQVTHSESTEKANLLPETGEKRPVFIYWIIPLVAIGLGLIYSAIRFQIFSKN